MVLGTGRGKLFLYFYIHYMKTNKITPISENHQYRVPNTQYHLIEYRSTSVSNPFALFPKKLGDHLSGLGDIQNPTQMAKSGFKLKK